MSVLFTFPGQGAQRPGMIADLPDSPAVQKTLATAEQSLGVSLDTLDTADALADTRNVQIALTVVGVAAARHLIAEGEAPQSVMGLSIGAWPAAVIAEVLDFADALALVAERGRLMGEAYPSGYGMCAVLGLEHRRVTDLVENARAGGDAVYVANVNSAQQIVVAGANDALARLADAAKKAGARGTRVLDIAVPSHCELLDEPAAALAERADKVAFKTPQCAYFSANAKRRLWQAEAIAKDLVDNMARTVWWAASCQIAHESGFTLFVEMPPGATLTGLHPDTETPGDAIAVHRSGWHNAQSLIRRADDSLR